MINWLLEPLPEPVVLRSLAELALLGLIAGTLGCWIVLAGRAYSAESLAHSMLPGLVGAALLGNGRQGKSQPECHGQHTGRRCRWNKPREDRTTGFHSGIVQGSWFQNSCPPERPPPPLLPKVPEPLVPPEVWLLFCWRCISALF